MIECAFYLMILGITPTDDTPRDIAVWDCGLDLRYTLEGKEVYVYDIFEDEQLYIYEEKK